MKKLISLLLAMLLALSMVSLVACDAGDEEPSHEHSYSQVYKNDKDKHWRACSCGEETDKGDHEDADTNNLCDVCGREMEDDEPTNPNTPTNPSTPNTPTNPSTPSTPDTPDTPDTPTIPTPQTPVVPNHPTSGDSTYKGQSAATVYANAMTNLTGSGNYTFNADHYIKMSLVVPDGYELPEGYSTSLGFQTMKAVYGYADNEFYGREEVVVDMTEAGMEEASTMVAQIVCDDNVVYMLAEINGQADKMKDDGSYKDLQSSTNIPLDVKDNRLYAPSSAALSSAYFNLSEDGATLTVKLSGSEAEAFIEDMRSDDVDFQFSDIVYIVHLDENGNLVKINYLFQIFAELQPGMLVCYDYDCTVTITDVDKTVVTAPSDADTYTAADFI